MVFSFILHRRNLNKDKSMLYTCKITDNKHFMKLYNKGNKIFTPFMVVYYQVNKLPYNRIGLTAGKKVGNAVKRNHARRLIRAAYTENEIRLPMGYDFVFVARSAINDAKYSAICDIFSRKIVDELSKKK